MNEETLRTYYDGFDAGVQMTSVLFGLVLVVGIVIGAPAWWIYTAGVMMVSLLLLMSAMGTGRSADDYEEKQ